MLDGSLGGRAKNRRRITETPGGVHVEPAHPNFFDRFPRECYRKRSFSTRSRTPIATPGISRVAICSKPVVKIKTTETPPSTFMTDAR